MSKQPEIISLKSKNGTTYQFNAAEKIGSGAMKDVYFSPDKSYVIGFFRKSQDHNTNERLDNIVNKYHTQIFSGVGAENIKPLFCWPEAIVEWDRPNKRTGNTDHLLGVVVPTYNKEFFFSEGKFVGKEKEGKWFASARLRNKFLETDQKGTWINYLSICLQIARAVKRMHAAGLAHSDLSYKNVLVNPLKGHACIIDIDGLVVPGKFPPDVVGTPDFIAPEVLETVKLPLGDKSKKVPSILTDRHALAVLIYMYLLFRHPLRGGMICSQDSDEDENLCMGKKALFIENPNDASNRPKLKNLKPEELPQGDISKLPYTICGPYLKDLFDRAFIDGLHDPKKRPTADDWERALIKTIDLLQPCQNDHCDYKWFVFDNKQKPKCPFCGQDFKGELPILNLYYRPRVNEKFMNEKHRIMVYSRQCLYKWHVDRMVVLNEKLPLSEKKPVGDFCLHKGHWILINRELDNLKCKYDGSTSWQKVDKGGYVELKDKTQILFDESSVNSRLAVVQLVKN